MGKHIAYMAEMRNAYKNFRQKTEGKRPLGRPRSRWEYNIKLDAVKVLTGFNWLRIGPSGGLL
jgi:hypothetical protein